MKKIFLALIVLLTIPCQVNSAAANNLPNNFRHGISTFGDLKYSADFKNFDYVNPDAPKGGTVKYGVEGTFNNLNPFILKGISAAGIEMIFDSLMEGSADEIDARYGLIAESVALSKDKKSVTFNLRKNARWHNNEPITADDVVFSFQILTSSGHPSYQMIYSDVLRAEKINDHQVRFIFKNGQNRDLPIAVASMPVLPKKYYQQNEFAKTTLLPPLGSGAYRVKSIDPGRSITYERVKNYWGRDLAVNRGRYNFDIITYDYYRDINVLLEAFKAGAYDFRQENVARNWATAYNIAKVQNGEIVKTEIQHQNPGAMQCFVFNLRREKFQNPALRQAISYAFDFEWVQKKIFYGSYQRTESYFVNSIFASSGKISSAELDLLQPFANKIPAEIFSEIYHLPKSDASGYNRAALLEAAKILNAAGYKVVDGKLLDPKNSQPVEIEFLLNSKAFQMIVAPFVNNLAKLGIAARMRLVDENQYQIRLDNYDYDIITHIFGAGLIPGNEQMAYWHSSQKNIKGGRNMGGISDEAVDELVMKITRAKSKAELQNLTRALDRVLLWNFYTVPQWHNNSYRILYKNKFVMPKTRPLYSIGLDSWWIKQE